MQVPGLTIKIVVNMGVGEAARDSKLMDGAVRDLTTITGQKPAVTRPANQSLSSSCVKPANRLSHDPARRPHVGVLDRLLSVSLPRIRDFRGLASSVRWRGNYTFGLNEQAMFAEINQDSIDRVRGMDITVVTTAKTTMKVARCSRRWAFPSRPSSTKGDLTRWQRLLSKRSKKRKPKFAVRAYTRVATVADVHTRFTASSACAGFVCARWLTAANCPVSPNHLGKHPTLHKPH